MNRNRAYRQVNRDRNSRRSKQRVQNHSSGAAPHLHDEQYQRGGRVRRFNCGGRVMRGSGMIDTTSGPNRFTVDDVQARVRETGEQILIGRDEFIINSRSAKSLGYNFLERLNRTGLVEGGGFQRGVLPGSNYQRGGRINRRKRNRRR